TSSLDSESEGLIQQAMERLMKSRTSIVIAHRLSTVRSLDRILVFDRGEIVEQGTHAVLTTRPGGTYRGLFELQATEFGRVAAAGERNTEKKRVANSERYRAAIRRALEIAMQISDNSMRDVSVGQIIRLCVRVEHLKTASVLLRAIGSDKTRAELIVDYPQLI